MDEANNLQALVQELPAPGVVAVPVVPHGQQVELLPRLQRAGGRTKKRCWMYMAEKCGDQEADQIRGRRMNLTSINSIQDRRPAQRTLEHADPAEHVVLVPRVHERPRQPHDALLLVLLGRGLGDLPLASLVN